MTPEAPSTERIARLEQRVDDMDKRLDLVAGLATEMATLSANVKHLEKDISDDMATLRDDVAAIHGALTKRDEAVSAERRETKVALYALCGTLVTALAGAGATILVTVLG